ncbi:Uncharacterised protein [Pandoraea pulmonicola]|uniref:Uncharacterized protein n=1 Tax=Pandoraea pulmonicola TaxID=93221 RepID=A0AAJ4ZCQ4_PANPU|nr:Uncharacterised protein [Pandoraea pulmonicola]
MVNVGKEMARLKVGTEGSILEEFDFQNLVELGKKDMGWLRISCEILEEYELLR